MQCRLKCKWTRKLKGKGEDETPHSVFPFKYLGKTYYSCTKDGTASYAPYTWCATKVDGDGNMIKNGICDPDCPGVGKKFLQTYLKFYVQNFKNKSASD